MEIKILKNKKRNEEKEKILKLYERENLPAKGFTLNQDFDKKKSKNSNPEEEKDNSKVLHIMDELNSLIGLDEVKKIIHEVMAFVEIRKRRQRESLYTEPLTLHMIFKGNPGTGKTTVARIISRLFREMGILSKGHIIEAERADLVGEYIGHTAQKTREQINKALGGVLFIDEAYSLARGGEKDFGKEAIDVMVKHMEDNRDNFILILAGYKDEMKEFISSNPGLRSRFPIHIDFPDYTLHELLDIADLMLGQRQYQFDPGAREEMKRIISLQIGRGYEHNGNARLVRNVIEKAIRRQAVRLVKKDQVNREDLLTITTNDIEEARRQCLKTVQ